ncbi:MAG: hypothetical protein F4146_07510 [Rhodothermaceae bacterium]|nr:hypothetical protein [Rhodothermaceae bacterium]MYF39477.1 hypothetical protein [Rhodothermaceae bacterium]MYH08357.1 hypothetical protein [Rhodothermaceae bacterium]
MKEKQARLRNKLGHIDNVLREACGTRPNREGNGEGTAQDNGEEGNLLADLVSTIQFNSQ